MQWRDESSRWFPLFYVPAPLFRLANQLADLLQLALLSELAVHFASRRTLNKL
jgi:hypothetical protein